MGDLIETVAPGLSQEVVQKIEEIMSRNIEINQQIAFNLDPGGTH